jgi:hypothetical protein
VLLQIDQQMSRGEAITPNFPDCRFDQHGRPLPGETALDLFDAGDIASGPDVLQRGGNGVKSGKTFSPSMQVDQIVMPRSGECALCANPKDAVLEACEPACGLGLGEIASPSFGIFHACFGDEELAGCECAHHIRQLVMGCALKHGANREWGVFRRRQAIGCGKPRANVATRVARDKRMVFEPQQETFFELATERLPDMGSRTCLEAGNPPGNGATRNFEQIDAFASRCDQQHPSCKRSR